MCSHCLLKKFSYHLQQSTASTRASFPVKNPYTLGGDYLNFKRTSLKKSYPLSPFKCLFTNSSDSGGSEDKEFAHNAETQAQSLAWEDLLEKGMTTHSSILTRRIQWTEELGRLQSMGWQRVRQNGATNTHTHTHTHTYIQTYTHRLFVREVA